MRKDIDSSLEVINLLSELVVFNQYNFEEFLGKFIRIILGIIQADSCLIYFFDRDKKQLMLVGSKKPHKESLEHITMKEGEGITGWVAEHKQTVAIEKEAYKDTRFKFFKELPEDKFESFLSIPILDGEGLVGVINIQNRLPFFFDSQKIKTVESLSKIVASAFMNVVLERKVHNLATELAERKIIEKAKGIIMREKNLSEENAFQFIRNEAMKKRRTMKEIAHAIILVMS